MKEPELIVVGGANGAGKSTFAIDHAVRAGYPYFGADSIAAELAPIDPMSVRISASQLFLERIRAAVDEKHSMVVETKLAGKSMRRFIQLARDAGYRVTILFVFLDSAETCVDRVHQRTLMGGHDVPVSDIRRRFKRSAFNFWNTYRTLADFWMLVYNSGDAPENVAIGSEDDTIVRITDLFELFHSIVEDHD
jgi:predicted ABC-type ATPase